MSKDRKYILAMPLVAAAFLVGGLWTGYYLAKNNNNATSRAKLDTVFGIIDHNYVDPVDFDSLVELAIPELLSNLDPHSAYIPASERIAANRDLEG